MQLKIPCVLLIDWGNHQVNCTFQIWQLPCVEQSKNVICNKCLEDNPSRIDLITCKCFHENLYLKESRVQVVWAPSNSRLERFIPATSFGELGGEITAPMYNWLWLVDCDSNRQLLPNAVQDLSAIKEDTSSLSIVTNIFINLCFHCCRCETYREWKLVSTT